MSAAITYLDFAATAALRPPEVARAMAGFMEHIGATPGRGGYAPALAAGRLALRCRQLLASLFDLPGDPGRTAFMLNATHALNTALWGVLERGDTVVVTAYDHNAVLRPIHRLARERGVQVRMVPGHPDGGLEPEQVARALAGAKLLVLNGASNVLGTVPDLAGLSALARAAGALVLVDGAQLGGHVPFRVRPLAVDLLAFTGHKGLLGPQGMGGLWVREGIEVEPLLAGGTGSDSLASAMPDSYPDHLEAGTQNAPGIAGLVAALEWILERGVTRLHTHARGLKLRLWHALAGVSGIRLRSPEAPQGIPLVTFTADRLDAATLARRLEAEHGVVGRWGLHCAPEVHRLLGTAERGALRFSLGWCTNEEQVDRAVAAVDRVVNQGRWIPGAALDSVGAGGTT